MAAPGTQPSFGSVNSTNAVINVRTLGYKPSAVWLRTGGDEGYWQKDMADDSMHKRLAAGTGSLATSNGITPLSDGFSIGADAAVNPAVEETIYWYALP